MPGTNNLELYKFKSILCIRVDIFSFSSTFDSFPPVRFLFIVKYNMLNVVYFFTRLFSRRWRYSYLLHSICCFPSLLARCRA